MAPLVERFVHRHILGLQPDPDHWPVPHDVGGLAVPAGMTFSDDAGQTLILANEFYPTWPRRRTAIGAHAYRFEENGELDCGWRLADVAARFLRDRCPRGFDLAVIVPPPDTYGCRRILPWVAERLARVLDIQFKPALFETACPLAAHPDRTRRPTLPITEIFQISHTPDVPLKDARVLLLDWRRHSGKTLLILARILRKCGAEVMRFTWLG
jgi:hypothetical protein